MFERTFDFQLPIDDSSLVYGSSDAGRTTHFSDEKSLELCKALGTKLNLKGHRPAKNAEDVKV